MVVATAGEWTVDVAEMSDAPPEVPCAAWVRRGGQLVVGYGRGRTRRDAVQTALQNAHAHSGDYRREAADALWAALLRIAF
ncbi:MAG TPA: hypothetical protein VGF55_05880 [Gemmataceae bacterium]|jgi:hypothetical protein